MIYAIEVTAKNDHGDSSDTLMWEVTEATKAYSNIVGGDFLTLEEKAPQLEFNVGIVTKEGSSGVIDLNKFNVGGEATSWESTGELPPGAVITAQGNAVYHNVGVDPEEGIHVATHELGAAFVKLIREVMKNGRTE